MVCDTVHSNSAFEALPIRIFLDTGYQILVNVTKYNIAAKAFLLCWLRLISYVCHLTTSVAEILWRR